MQDDKQHSANLFKIEYASFHWKKMLEKRHCLRDKCCLKSSKLTQNESITTNLLITKSSHDCWHYFFFVILPGMTMIVGMTAAARTRATSSPSPSPSSPWAWASSSSPRLLNPPRLPQQPYPLPATPATACFPCHSAWVYASIMTRAGCTFMMLTRWGAFMRGRWIVQEQCILLLVSWAAARFSWRSLSPLRDWLSEEGWSVLMHDDLQQFDLSHVWRSAGFIDLFFCRLGEAFVISLRY